MTNSPVNLCSFYFFPKANARALAFNVFLLFSVCLLPVWSLFGERHAVRIASPGRTQSQQAAQHAQRPTQHFNHHLRLPEAFGSGGEVSRGRSTTPLVRG